MIFLIFLLKIENFKGSADPSHFIFKCNVGKSRIRHIATLILIEWWISRSTPNRLKMTSFKFRVVLCRIRSLPTLISKIKSAWTTLKKNYPFSNHLYSIKHQFPAISTEIAIFCQLLSFFCHLSAIFLGSFYFLTLLELTPFHYNLERMYLRVLRIRVFEQTFKR